MVLLAVLIFAAGAFSGAFLGENRPASQGVPLEVEGWRIDRDGWERRGNAAGHTADVNRRRQTPPVQQ